ncbi:MAG: DUF3486 family protein [Rhodospirillum sp.]|nr:DUF3486 family protein [Rhodospirillum sp.]MCF8491370.1 DUF3486 family protein [Rhodospirillum sp.]MCF8500194.1 DUF3486 family protein [Rhodospirillum sp.]
MGRVSSIRRLPAEVKSHIEARLAQGEMTLNELIADLEGRFPEEAKRGDLPSRSALGRYGQNLNRRLAAIRASTEAAKIISANAEDSADARSEALTAMIQTELFESIMVLQEASDDTMEPGDRVSLLAKAAKDIATLTRSSVTLKRYQAEAEDRGRAKLLAEQAEALKAMGGQGGVTEETKARIRDALGIA